MNSSFFRSTKLLFIALVSLVLGISSITYFCTSKKILLLDQTNYQLLLLLSTILWSLLIGVFLINIDKKIMHTISKSSLSNITKENFLRLNKYAYLTLFLSIGCFFKIRFNYPLVIILICLFLLAQGIILLYSMTKEETNNIVKSEHYIPGLFFVSGFSALIYQILWQRELFVTFGTNIEAVTIIVSIFMFGLGIGALIGSILARSFPQYSMHLFLLIELAIGIYGLFSVNLISFADQIFENSSYTDLVILTYAILAIPTLLMGATMPLLIRYLDQYYNNIGKTVSRLYSLNTLGSAFAAFFTVSLLLVLFSKQTVIWIAAIFNILNALGIYVFSKVISKEELKLTPTQTTNPIKTVPFGLAIFISMLAGFIALSQEMIWYRILNFVSGSSPKCFGMLLFTYLLGIGLGTLRIDNKGRDIYYRLAFLLLTSVLIFYFAAPLISNIPRLINIIGFLLAGICAYYSAPIFPILASHVVGNKENESFRASIIYLANIIGATAGPIIVGFVLFDNFTLKQNIAHLTILSLAIVIVIAYHIKARFDQLKIVSIALSIVCFVFLGHDVLYNEYLEKTQYKEVKKEERPFRHIIETRSGIITVKKGAKDTVFGGGVFDGRINVDIQDNTNGINRTYLTAALHPQPKRALFIGLSAGAWVQILGNYKQIDSLDVIEINKGYVELISRYPEVSGILTNPKINIHFADARNWLKKHKDKYDMIAMNTTFHWRANSTNILSKQFFDLLKTRLNPGGVVYLNTTGSPEVIYTIAHSFKHIVQIDNFIAGSDSEFNLRPEQIRKNLLEFYDQDGKQTFTKDNEHNLLLEKFSYIELKDLYQDYIARKDLWLITDDNLAVEYKLSNPFTSIQSENNWKILFKKLRKQ